MFVPTSVRRISSTPSPPVLPVAGEGPHTASEWLHFLSTACAMPQRVLQAAEPRRDSQGVLPIGGTGP